MALAFQKVMGNGSPNVRHIEAFNAVMKSGSVTRASEVLYLSQPAVTKLIQAFEASCGFQLFTRDTGRLVPTPEAKQLLIETQRLEIGVDRVRKVADAIRDLERGEISVATFPAFGLQLLPRVVAEFLQKRSQVRITQLTRTSSAIDDAVMTRAADIGLSLLPSENPAVECSEFATTSMACVLPKSHALAQKQIIDLADLAHQPLVALGTEDMSSQVIGAALQNSGVRMRVTAEVQLAQAAVSMVSAGYGVSIVTSLAAFGSHDPNVTFRPLKQKLTNSIWVMRSAFEQPSELAVALLYSIRAAIEEAESTFHSEGQLVQAK